MIVRSRYPVLFRCFALVSWYSSGSLRKLTASQRIITCPLCSSQPTSKSDTVINGAATFNRIIIAGTLRVTPSGGTTAHLVTRPKVNEARIYGLNNLFNNGWHSRVGFHANIIAEQTPGLILQTAHCVSVVITRSKLDLYDVGIVTEQSNCTIEKLDVILK